MYYRTRQIWNFKNYIDIFIGKKLSTNDTDYKKKIFFKIRERWKIKLEEVDLPPSNYNPRDPDPCLIHLDNVSYRIIESTKIVLLNKHNINTFFFFNYYIIYPKYYKQIIISL